MEVDEYVYDGFERDREVKGKGLYLTKRYGHPMSDEEIQKTVEGTYEGRERLAPRLRHLHQGKIIGVGGAVLAGIFRAEPSSPACRVA